jgi:hypothetical protein
MEGPLYDVLLLHRKHLHHHHRSLRHHCHCHCRCRHLFLRMFHHHHWNPSRRYYHRNSVWSLHLVFNGGDDYWYNYRPILQPSAPPNNSVFYYVRKSTCSNYVRMRMLSKLAKESALQ